jgi:hypothetical protein
MRFVTPIIYSVVIGLFMFFGCWAPNSKSVNQPVRYEETRTRDTDTVFHCQGKPEPEPIFSSWPEFDLPPGRFEIKSHQKKNSSKKECPPKIKLESLGEIVEQVPNNRCEGWKDKIRSIGCLIGISPVILKIVAENIPIGRLASELSRVLGIKIMTGQYISDRQVALSIHEISFTDFLILLAEEYEVEYQVDHENQTLIILADKDLHQYKERLHARLMASASIEPLKVRIIPVVAGLPPAQLAALYCDQIASERGSASVIGNNLLIKDQLEELTKFEGLINDLAKTTQSHNVAPGSIKFIDPFVCAKEMQTDLASAIQYPKNISAGKLDLKCSKTDKAKEDMAQTSFRKLNRYRLPKDLAQVSCKLQAANVPLGLLVTAMSEQLGFGVLVDTRLLNKRVSMSIPEGSVYSLLTALDGYFTDNIRYHDNILRFNTDQAAQKRIRNSWACRKPTKKVWKFIRVDPKISMEQFANICCHEMVSSDGAMAVVGHYLILHDQKERIDIIEGMLNKLIKLSSAQK